MVLWDTSGQNFRVKSGYSCRYFRVKLTDESEYSIIKSAHIAVDISRLSYEIPVDILGFSQHKTVDNSGLRAQITVDSFGLI